MKKQKYAVAWSSNLCGINAKHMERFCEQVNEFLDNGWKVSGGVASVGAGHDYRLFQALVMEVEVDDPPPAVKFDAEGRFAAITEIRETRPVQEKKSRERAIEEAEDFLARYAAENPGIIERQKACEGLTGDAMYDKMFELNGIPRCERCGRRHGRHIPCS